jgi:hypothetical protein
MLTMSQVGAREVFQLGHVLSDMDRAAILRPLLQSEKTRFASIPLTLQSFYERLALRRLQFNMQTLSEHTVNYT